MTPRLTPHLISRLRSPLTLALPSSAPRVPSVHAEHARPAGAGRLAPPKFLSEADCHALLERITTVTSGGGHTAVAIHSNWTGNVRWARNEVTTSGDVRTDGVHITRNLNGAINPRVFTNDTTTAGLLAAVRQAERLVRLDTEHPRSDLVTRYQPEQPLTPKLFSEATYQLEAAPRTQAAVQLMQTAKAAGMLTAGYIEVSAHSIALLDTYGRSWYFPYTQAQYSVTVRDPKGTGSGWAGVDWYDWTKIDAPALTQRALEKCLQSRNAVKIEPGRYTTILEPQAVCDFVSALINFDRPFAESDGGPFAKSPGEPAAPGKPFKPGLSKLGDKVIDERLSLGADPMDPELGFPPFDLFNGGEDRNLFSRFVYHPVMWIERGVLTHLSYDRGYALGSLGQDVGFPENGAFRMSVDGPTSSIEEMIATTKRGLLVTRFDQVRKLQEKSVLCRGNTRDGLWFIENGKISKPVQNLVFTESVLFALNNVEQIGVPQRVFHPQPAVLVFPQPPRPAIVPALKIRDFSFTALDDAV